MKKMLFYRVLNNNSLIILLFVLFFVNLNAQKINTHKACKSLNIDNFKTKGIDFIVYNRSTKPKPILLFIRNR